MISFIYSFISFFLILQVHSQCIPLTQTKCGSEFYHLQVSESVFPTFTLFDKTIDRFIRGTDSVSLLKDYVGCEWDPRVDSRYPHTFFCHLIARQERSVGECSNDASYPTLCASTCSKWLRSLTTIFENKELCSNVDEKKVANRQNLFQKWKEFCSGPFVSSHSTCMKHTDEERSFCGFGTLNAAVKFCIKNPKRDTCCNDRLIQQRLGHLPTSNNSPSTNEPTDRSTNNESQSTQNNSNSNDSNSTESNDTTSEKNANVCNFWDWNCSVPLKVTLAVCLICIPAIIALLYWKKRLDDSAHEDYIVSIPTKDDEFSNDYGKYLEPKAKVEHAFMPKSPEKIRRFKTYSRQSMNLENGFTIYQCMFDHSTTREGEIQLKKGDQVVLKNIETDGYALGVNLNTGCEGLVLLTVLKTYYHTDDDDQDE